MQQGFEFARAWLLWIICAAQLFILNIPVKFSIKLWKQYAIISYSISFLNFWEVNLITVYGVGLSTSKCTSWKWYIHCLHTNFRLFLFLRNIEDVTWKFYCVKKPDLGTNHGDATPSKSQDCLNCSSKAKFNLYATYWDVLPRKKPISNLKILCDRLHFITIIPRANPISYKNYL